ncbi:unnamed protein product [Microthlaspi erraticum]|uniref:Uncharacterized protein n=1 Tax=Microthlaspi erraticum TaxID=1685480 RepID=A0A6D2K124_9BRAS|nr:unnamed protein product [Microthlaspi erraticum]
MEHVQEGEDTQFAEVCYMSNGQGGYNKRYYNYKANPAMSYRNTDVANPQDQVYPQQQQARSSQAPQREYGPKNYYHSPQGTFPADGVVDTSKKLAEINSKIENLNTRVYSLENHASYVVSATKQGQLSGKAIQNPNDQCKVIFTQERLDEEEDQERVMDEFCLLLNDDGIVAAEAPGVPNDQPEVHATTVAFHTSPPVDPSSCRLLSQSHKEVIHQFRRDLSEIEVELPSMESMSETFEQMKLIQDVMANKEKVSELLEMSTHQINLLTSPTFLPKCKYQPNLPHNGRKAWHCWSIAAPYYFNHVWRCNFKISSWCFKNYHLKIGECIIQTDLTVMEMEEGKDLPLLLGTPFLSTVGASIDFHKQEVEKDQRVDKGTRIEKPRLERPRLERPRSDRPRADRLVQAPCVLDEESLQALFDEPLGSLKKKGRMQPQRHLWERKERTHQLRFPQQAISAHYDLVSTKFENGKIEYKIRYKGRSRPFSRAKALVTSEQSRIQPS